MSNTEQQAPWPLKISQGFLQTASLSKEISDGWQSPSIYTDGVESVLPLLESILLEAIELQASDIHFEPYATFCRVRFRVDGLLREASKKIGCVDLAARILSCIKVLSHLDISEKRLPQDGHFSKLFPGREIIYFRVSTCPLNTGEKAVVRIFDQSKRFLDLDQLGLGPQQLYACKKAFNKPQGMILITGPTGCGKSETLYSALRLLNTGKVNISTVEDPVEIKMPGINQVDVNPKIGLTFAKALAAFLRQDPDIIMLGEIRCLETATMAMQAAQTGHLLLSTLHSNSAIESFERLYAIGLSYEQMASSLSLIVAQRLVRRLCTHCKVWSLEQKAYRAQGCGLCFEGYQGRLGLFEVLPMSESLQDSLLDPRRRSACALKKQARQAKHLGLYEAGKAAIDEGITTFEELQRVVPEAVYEQ